VAVALCWLLLARLTMAPQADCLTIIESSYRTHRINGDAGAFLR
jgi:hypothetical protein